MPTAASSPAKKTQQGLYCVVDDTLVPPILRILLSTGAPRQIDRIEHDYEPFPCERMALTMINDEDSGIRITLAKTPQQPRVADHIQLNPRNAGDRLLFKNNFIAGSMTLAGPNVDITKRDDPVADGKHVGVHTVHRLYMAAAFRLLLGNQDASNSGVAALIVSPAGQVIGWGKKNPSHPVLHAEASALLANGARLPKGARIYSTLKPCKMCRALIEHFATDNDFVVYYGQDDPTKAAMGPMGADRYVLMRAGNKDVKPIWSSSADKDKAPALRNTVTQDLGTAYNAAKDKDYRTGMIDFIKDAKAKPHLNKAAGFLDVKMKQYDTPSVAKVYNPNVKSCLAHIAAVMKALSLPGPKLN